MPELGALLARRQVPGTPGPGIAEAHRDHRDAPVVEAFGIDPQPRAQAFAAEVVPRHAALVDSLAGSLTDDQQPSVGMRAHHRARSEWEMLGADVTAPDLRQQASDSRRLHAP